jgi:trimeric autotransporter adhesin
MKRQIQGLLGLTALALGLGLGFSAPALATNYTCAAVPASVSGDTIIGTAGTACVIPAAGVTGSGNITVNGSTITTTGNLTAGASFTLNATSTVSINAVNSTGPLTLTTTAGTITTTTLTAASRSDVQINGVGNVTTGAVSAGGNIKAVSSSAILFLNGTVTSNTGAGGGNILLQAGTNVRTGAISTSGGAKTGAVQIDANKNGGNTLFTVGSNATNGVTSVNTSNSTGGGNSPTSFVGGLLINNGTAASTGGISVTSMSAINVAASASRSGAILLNAQNGTLTLPAGTLSSNGAAGFGAGQIILLANTVTTANGTIISAAQTSSAGATVHGVAIAATTVNVAGTSGLQLLGDGSGPSTATAVAGLFPKGAISISSSNVYNTLTWTVSPFTVKTNGPMTVAGASAPITLSANGDNSQVTVTGYPINFTNGAVNLSAKGSLGNGHNIVVQYSGSFTGTNGLTFGGNGAVTLDTSGNTGNDSAGAVSIMVDQASIAASVPSLTINANGSGSGNGGTVTVQPTKIVTLAAPTVNISANGPFGYVQFQPVLNQTTTGDASITSTTFNLNANGPTSGGNAGTIFYYTKNSTYGSSTKMKFSAIGPTSGSGNGGTITVYPGSVTGGTFKLGTNAGDLQVLANAGSTGGDGGSITVNPYPAPNGNISIETANAVSATSSSGATANSKGGNVTLIANPNLSVVSTLTGAAVNVDGKGTSDGGSIKIWANGTLNVGSSVGALALSAKADPAGKGNGGTIEIGYLTNLTTSDTLSVAGGAGASSNGKGGTINIHDSGTITVGTSNFDASAKGTGNGGNITINTAGANIDLSQASIKAIADPNGSGNGGKVEVAHAQGAVGQGLSVNTIIKVDGSDSLRNIAENDFGRIKINSTTCQQRTTGLTPWPKTYWNCQHLDTSTAADMKMYAGANKLNAVNKSALNTAQIQLYIMRDPLAFADYHGVGPGTTTGIFGYSWEALRVSAVFFQLLTSGAPDTSANAYYSGTVIHEMSHQLNYWTWGHVDSTGATWLGHFNTATTNFDAPGLPPPAVNNCSTVVDADRIANGHNAICSTFDGVTIDPATNQPYPFKKNSNGLAVEGGEPGFVVNEERFADAFAASYQRLYPTDIIIDLYITALENRLTDEHAYMDNVRDTGTPAP